MAGPESNDTNSDDESASSRSACSLDRRTQTLKGAIGFPPGTKLAMEVIEINAVTCVECGVDLSDYPMGSYICEVCHDLEANA